MFLKYHNQAVDCIAYDEPSKVFTIAASILMTAFLFLGVCGNAWTLGTLIRNKGLRQNLINIFIMSLCLNDFINLTLVQTFVIASYYFGRWVVGHLTCYIVPELNMILVGTSLWHHAFIAFHRYLVVVRFHFYQRIPKELYILVVIVGSRAIPTILTIVFNSLSYVDFKESRGDEFSTNQTTFEYIESFCQHIMFYSPYLLRCVYKRTEKKRKISVLVLTVVVPCIVVVFCFTVIFAFVRRKKQSMNRHKEPSLKNPTIQIQINGRISSLENICSNQPTSSQSDSQMACENLPLSNHDEEITGSRACLHVNPLSRNRSFDSVPGWYKFSLVSRKSSFTKRVTTTGEKRQFSREISITKMFGIIFALLVIGYLPYGLIRMFDRSSINPEICPPTSRENASLVGQAKEGTPPDVYVFFSALYAIASCCNPLIFGLFHKDVRKNAIKSLQCIKRVRQTS